MATAQRPATTDMFLSLTCPQCGESLSVAESMPSLAFRCPQRHVTTLAALRSLGSPKVDQRLGNLLQGWEQRHALLGRIAQDALAKGYQLLAEDAFAQMRLLEERAQNLSRQMRPSWTPSPTTLASSSFGP